MRFLLLLLLPLFLSAEEITLKFIQSKPKSLARDWYIARFFEQKNLKPKEADTAYSLLFRVTEKLEKKYLPIATDKAYLKRNACRNMSLDRALKEDDECLYLSATINKAYHITPDERVEAARRIEKKNRELAENILFYNGGNLAQRLIDGDGARFVKFFNSLPISFRKQELNFPYPSELLERISGQKGILQMIKDVLKDEEFAPLKESLYDLNSSKISFEGSRLLMMSAIKENKIEKALNIAIGASRGAQKGLNSDNALMWCYLLSNDEMYLQELSESGNLNIFSLYAKEKLGVNISFPDDTEASNTKYRTKERVYDPFFWPKFQEQVKDANSTELQKLATKYNNYESEPYRANIIRKLEGHGKHLFLTPYEDEFAAYDTKRKIMLLSLAKQESNFIPSVVSTSYALGMMQIMPFNVEAMLKAKKQKVVYESAFEPKNGIEFGNSMVGWLENRFKHPLLISYAYNGGAGFTGKMLKSGLFDSDGEYEPWLSMERVWLDESRDYGKKVLGNYVIYSHMLGHKESAVALIESLKNLKTGKKDEE